MPSFILIHPTVWPQYTNVTDREDRQDSQWSDSIGRTILQTVAQKGSVTKRFVQKRIGHLLSVSLPRMQKGESFFSGSHLLLMKVFGLMGIEDELLTGECNHGPVVLILPVCSQHSLLGSGCQGS